MVQFYYCLLSLEWLSAFDIGRMTNFFDDTLNIPSCDTQLPVTFLWKAESATQQTWISSFAYQWWGIYIWLAVRLCSMLVTETKVWWDRSRQVCSVSRRFVPTTNCQTTTYVCLWASVNVQLCSCHSRTDGSSEAERWPDVSSAVT